MKNRIILLLSYFVDRAAELSTWLGLFTLLGWCGLKIPADKLPLYAQYGVVAFGVIAAVFPDDLRKLKALASQLAKGGA